MNVFVCAYCYVSEWDCMRRVVKNDFQCCSTVKNENCEDVNFHVVTTSLYDVAKISPKRCYKVSYWVSGCLLIMEIILNSFLSSKRKLKTFVGLKSHY